ncbi:olfactory ionotropic receptor IR4 [Penaeus vannamei]|uniref:Olfactory ionotropic receptor IR4 n=1 Tax=Penaeus vannamei TaxID=6689 RepID=A0A423T0R9_PENVA|nr:olfactory ionotropic receptor IR4 [Penaeus vannamei]
MGVSLFQATSNGSDIDSHLSRIIEEAKKLRELSWCVSVVVVSDDPAALLTFSERSLQSQFIVWSTRLLVVTHLRLGELSRLHESLSKMNAMVMTLRHEQKHTSCSFYVHMPYSPAGEETVQVASWDSAHGLVLRGHLPVFPEKYSRLRHRAEIVVAAEEYPPHAFVLLLGGLDGRGQPRFTITGPMVKLLEILATSMNFTYTYVRPPDGAWGAKQPDGSFSGMVGMLSRKEADIGLGPFGVSASRAEVVDYTGFIVIDYARIIGGRGRAERFSPGRRSAGLCFSVVRVLLFQGECELPHVYVNTESAFAMKAELHYAQDAKVPPGRRWERVLLAGWMIVTLVTVKSYAGNLMSLLAVRHIPQPYQSVRDVLDDPACTMIWETNNAYIQYMNPQHSPQHFHPNIPSTSTPNIPSTSTPTYHFHLNKPPTTHPKILLLPFLPQSLTSGTFYEVAEAGRNGRIIYRRSTDFMEAVDTLVRKGDHVLMVEDLTARVFLGKDVSSTGRCDFYLSRDVFLPFIFAMTGQKNSPFVPALNRRIRAVTESGLYNHWMQGAIPNSTTCANAPSKITVHTTLGLSNLWLMFAILLGGHVISVIVLLLEIFWNKMK